MPRPSAFNSTHFSSRPPHGEKFYREIVKALGGERNYTTDFNSVAMGRVYAQAMAYGRCLYTLERAASQFRPSRALELLPALEAEYGLVPEPGASIPDRRAELAVAAWVARGAKRTNVEAILVELFGADFVRYITVATADAVDSTTTPADVGVYVKAGQPRSVFRAQTAIARTGILISVICSPVAGDAMAPAIGSRVIVDPGDFGRAEAVTVVSAAIINGALHLGAVFTKAHLAGVVIATGRHPNITTNKRNNVFLMATDSARSNRTRRRLSRAADRLLRGVSTWAITDGSGPFKVGVGRVGITTIGTVT